MRNCPWISFGAADGRGAAGREYFRTEDKLVSLTPWRLWAILPHTGEEKWRGLGSPQQDAHGSALT